MDVAKLKERLEKLEQQRINTIANLGAIEGAQATVRDLMAEIEAEATPVKDNVVPFPSVAPVVGASQEVDTHQADVPQEA